ncbi:MAG: Ig-like domain-containing protein [Pseudomonadota bacterium]
MGTLSGQTMTWHKITVDFISDQTFQEEPSTFRDYRLDVTFTNRDTGETLVVPGFFAADGNAAETGATEGQVWRVNFNPPSEGDWEYSASFRTGTDIAASTDPNAGSNVGFGAQGTGSFEVTETTATEGFAAKGMILQDEGTHYLQHQGDGDYFIRGGPGVPENFLATQAFDNTGDGRHEFDAHSVHYGGDGDFWGDTAEQQQLSKNILGAVNYIADQGMNTIYMLTNTIGGDGQDVGPWVNDNIYDVSKNKNLNNVGNGLDEDDFSTYDISKLGQWEVLFDHMDDQGIYKNVLFQETENDQLLNNGTDVAGTTLDVERLVYMREMIARFGHNNGIQWNMGEENTNTDQELEDMAEFIEAIDPYGHLVVLHTYPNDINEVYDPLVGVEEFDGPSFQTGPGSIRNQTIEFRDKSAAAGDPWVLAWDEHAGNNATIDAGSNNPDSTNEKALRDGMWGHLTANGTGVNWYLKGNSFGGHSFDQNMDDFTGFTSLWTWTAAAVEFWNTYVPFWEMETDDGATTNGNDYAMVKDGEYYLVYAKYGQADDISLDLRGQGGETFDVFWFDPRNGGDLINGGQVSGGSVVDMGNPPSATGKDWVLFVRNADLPDTPPSVEPGGGSQPPSGIEGVFIGQNGTVVIEAESAKEIVGDWSEVSFDGQTGLLWDANRSSYGSVPEGETLTYEFTVDESGTYSLGTHAARIYSTMNNSDRYEGGNPDNGLRSDTGNDAYFALVEVETGEVVREPTKLYTGLGRSDQDFRWGKTFDVNHNHSPARFDLEEGVVYRLEVTGRSDGYVLDKMTLNKGNNILDDANAEESPVGTAGGGGGGGGGGGTTPVALGFSLVNAGNDQTVGDLEAGDEVSLADFPNGFSISANPDGAVGSVVFSIGGQVVQTENTAPFALFGDSGGDFDPADLGPGTYTVSAVAKSGSGGNGSTLGEASVTFTVVEDNAPPPNVAPVAVNDTATTEEDEAVLIDVLGNDSDANNDSLNISALDDPDNGSLELIGSIIEYTPDAGFSGQDTFSYTISDGEGGSDTATVTVTVEEADDPEPPQPVEVTLDLVLAQTGANQGNLAALEDGSEIAADLVDGKNVTVYAVAADGTDPADIGSVRLTIPGFDTQLENVAPYALFGDSSGIFNTGAELEPGNYQLTVTSYARPNGQGAVVGEQVINFTVAEPQEEENLPPVAVGETLVVAEDTLNEVDLLDNDSDPEGGPLTVEIVEGPQSGSGTLSGGIYEYLPSANFNGTDKLTYRVVDNEGQRSAPVELTINVTPVDDPADVTDTTIEIDEGDTLTLVASDLATDIDSQGLFFRSVTGEENGNVTLAGEASVLFYTPDPDFSGTETLIVEIHDQTPGGAVGTGTLTIVVNDVPDEPEPPTPTMPSFTFALAETDGDTTLMDEIEDGSVIPMELIDGESVTLYATTDDDFEGSVELSLDGGKTQLENFEPYAVFGDDMQGDFFDGTTLAPGEHELSYEVFAGGDKSGGSLGKGTVTFTVEDVQPDGSEFVEIGLYTTSKDEDAKVVDVVNGSVLDADDLSAAGKLSVGLLAADGAPEIGSIKLDYDGHTRIENVEPYALFGDIKGDFKGGTTFEEGDHTVGVTIYEDEKGRGDVIAEFDLEFTVA